MNKLTHYIYVTIFSSSLKSNRKCCVSIIIIFLESSTETRYTAMLSATYDEFDDEKHKKYNKNHIINVHKCYFSIITGEYCIECLVSLLVVTILQYYYCVTISVGV